MTRIGYPQSGLAALLDSLERELLAARADEVRDVVRETGRASNTACQEVRVLLNEAIGAMEEGSPAIGQPDTCTRLDRSSGCRSPSSSRKRSSRFEQPTALTERALL
jgi:hypothetical protein